MNARLTGAPPGRDPCAACRVAGSLERRQFLLDALTSTLAALTALGAAAGPAHALGVTCLTGTGGRTDKTYPIPAADGVVIDKDESVIIARFDGHAYAFSLACPHQNSAIRWDAGGRRFQCPKHKSRYRPDGSFISGRATRGLDRFAVRRDGERIVVNLDALYQEDTHGAEWKAAFVQL